MTLNTPFSKTQNQIQHAGCRFCSGMGEVAETRHISPTTTKHANILFMDTLALAKRLENKGFTREQAEILTQAYAEIMNMTLEHQTKYMVSKPQQEITVQQLMSHISSVKKDMVILEKSEFTMIRNDTEKQSIHIKQLEAKLEDEIKKLRGQVSLDINLEKGRATEAHAKNEKDLQSLINKIEVENAHTEKEIQAVNNKIAIEISNLRTQYEQYRNDVIKYSIGTIATCATVMLGFLRLWS